MNQEEVKTENWRKHFVTLNMELIFDGDVKPDQVRDHIRSLGRRELEELLNKADIQIETEGIRYV